jgi:hypothetical protein
MSGLVIRADTGEVVAEASASFMLIASARAVPAT